MTTNHLKSMMFPVIIVFLSSSFITVYCDLYELYNTKMKTSDLKWTSRGWEEVSGFDQNNNVIRHYQICDSDKPKQDNWIRSPFIYAKGATRLHVEIEFSIQKCDSPELVTAKYCRETFNLFYYESDTDVASSTFPLWREKPYEKVDTVAANNDGNINKKKFTIGPLKRGGLYLAAQDQGACMSINSLRVFYFLCPQTTQSLAVFPETIAGGEPTSLVPLEGKCVVHAKTPPNAEDPIYYCGSDGEWQILNGGCQCDPGYTPNVLSDVCKPCPAGTFKSNPGNEQCSACPSNSGPNLTSEHEYSLSSGVGLSSCSCKQGYFRSPEEKADVACSKPPSEPTTDGKSSANSTGAVIIWKSPLDLGGRTDVFYKINCLQCRIKTYESCSPCPNDIILKHPAGVRATVSGLRPYTPYIFKIFAYNGVSGVSGMDSKFAEVKLFTSEAAPTSITNIYIAKRNIKSVDIKWRRPEHPNGVIRKYEIEIRLHSDDSSEAHRAPTVKEATTESAILEDLEPNTEYVVRIRAKNSFGFGKYSELVQFSTLPSEPIEPPPQNNTVVYIVGAVVAVLLLLILFVIYARRNGRLAAMLGNRHKASNGHTRNEGLIGHRTYVEYPNPSQAVNNMNKELDLSKLTVLEKKIGEGEFALVLHGKLNVEGANRRVAVKQLKQGASVKDQSNFLREACSMAQFNHTNILKLEGVVTKSRPVMIVSEYMDNGALDQFVKNSGEELQCVQLVTMLRGIASGMQYLSEMQYVHRDLAARNILVNNELVCKVSDFGLSRTLENDPHAMYTTQGGKIAIRWTAPECIRYRQFTSASDVWSYGIVMWEVMSYGEKPYWDMTNQQVVQSIDGGMRLPAPTNCPKVLHDKMIECWSLDPNKRPKFSKIAKDLDSMKSNANMLIIPNGDIATPHPVATLATFCATPSLQHALNKGNIHSVEEWLKCQRLEEYKERFINHGLDSLDKVSNLTIKDLRSLGIDVTLHVHKLENGIRSLKRHLSASSSRPSSGYTHEDAEPLEDDVMISSNASSQEQQTPVRNGSFRVHASNDETAVFIPKGSVAV